MPVYNEPPPPPSSPHPPANFHFSNPGMGSEDERAKMQETYQSKDTSLRLRYTNVLPTAPSGKVQLDTDEKAFMYSHREESRYIKNYTVLQYS